MSQVSPGWPQPRALGCWSADLLAVPEAQDGLHRDCRAFPTGALPQDCQELRLWLSVLQGSPPLLSWPITPSGSTLAARNLNPYRARPEQRDGQARHLHRHARLESYRGTSRKLTVKSSAPSSEKHISSMEYSGHRSHPFLCCLVVSIGSGGQRTMNEEEVSIGQSPQSSPFAEGPGPSRGCHRPIIDYRTGCSRPGCGLSVGIRTDRFGGPGPLAAGRIPHGADPASPDR